MFYGTDIFNESVVSLKLVPFINNKWLDLILDSNPNFNFLYSNFSRTYKEPLNEVSKNLSSVPPSVLNLLCGDDLDVS